MKKIFLFLILIAITASISGCGKALDTPQNGELKPEEKTIIEYREPEMTKISEVEEEPEEDIEEIEGIINSIDTPCGKEDLEEEIETSYIPDIESYFEGNSCNLEKYLYDCGAESVEITSDGCTTKFYDWIIKIHSKSWSEIPEFSIENELNGKDYYFDPAGDPNIGNFYSVDSNNTLICEASLRKLPDLLNAFYDDGFAFEPPIVYGLIID